MMRVAVVLFVFAVASMQAASQLLQPQYLPSLPVPILPGLPPSPYIPTLPPYVNVNPIVDVIAPIVDVQSYTSLSCGCSSCGSAPYSTCGCGATPYSPCGCGATSYSPCGCGTAIPYGPTVYDCAVPTSVSVPVSSPCGCGVPLPTVPYSSYSSPCGCGLSTPLLPPLPPVVGCSKYLRQVCTQPPFL